ncbi:MAG: hypothetical protein NTX53_09825 [candidate division WOR-3 bacterium]|nr:hypothetical protein [candidate division WOR-3 bacterium]
MTKHRVLLATVLVTVLAASGAVGAQLNFGGDLGFVLFDVSNGSGIQPSRDSLGNAMPLPYGDTTGRVNTYLESHGLGLYWNVQLSDQVSVSALTEVGGTTTSATPSLGKKLGTQQGDAGTQKALSVPEAYIQVMLPWQVQMSTGIIRPIFSEDYGEKKGYQEANRLFKSSANAYGGEWHDLGVEFYKSFEPGGGFSIPAYAYLLAGEQPLGDDNSNKALLFHVAPAFWKLRVLGSYGFGKEGADGELQPWSRYAAGLGGDFGPFWFRGEFFGGSWAGNEVLNEANKDTLGRIIPDTVTFKPIAYYVKAGYNLIPDKLGVVLTFDQSSPDWTTRAKLGYSTQGGPTTDAGESYTTIGATVQYWVIPGSAILLEYNRGMWKVGDGTLCKINFNRITLGWRTIF